MAPAAFLAPFDPVLRKRVTPIRRKGLMVNYNARVWNSNTEINFATTCQELANLLATYSAGNIYRMTTNTIKMKGGCFQHGAEYEE